MKILTGRDKACKKIANALGIKHCKSLDLRFRIDERVLVTAEFYPSNDELKSLEPIFKGYELIEKKEQ